MGIKKGHVRACSVDFVGGRFMPSANAQDAMANAAGLFPGTSNQGNTSTAAATEQVSGFDLVKPESERGRERFIPVTRFALLDRLTMANAWPGGQAKEARRFFRYLDHWRRQQ